jgi:hypothetical protein
MDEKPVKRTKGHNRPTSFAWNQEPWTVKSGIILGIIVIIGDLFGAQFVTGHDHVTLNYLLVMLGGVVGFTMGMLISPYGAEKRQFSVIARTASAFLSGFVLAKADKLFDEATKEPGTIDAAFVGRVALFAVAAVITGLLAFLTRAYVGENSGQGHSLPLIPPESK